jgi:PIN domain nuclease of toxin-antitoxin system
VGILDTCTLLWLVADQSKLSANARDYISTNAGGLFVSGITGFEVALKNQRGRLSLPMPAGEWYRRALEFHGLRELAVTGQIGILAAELPPNHKDPCDRLIVATAQTHGLTIVTPDPLIAAYSGVNVLW